MPQLQFGKVPDLSLDPPLVYRYMNGDAARFVGYDLKTESPVATHVDLRAGWTYTFYLGAEHGF